MRKQIRTCRLKLTAWSVVTVLIWFHVSRDICQLFGWEVFWGQWAHGFGVKLTNGILGLVRMSYHPWTEAPWLAMEILAIKKVTDFKRKIREKLAYFEEEG